MHAKDWLIVHLYINMDWVSKSVYRHVQWKQNVYTALHWMDSAYTWPLLLQASQSTLHHPFVLIVANGLCFSCIKLLMDPLKCNWDWICGRSVCLLAASNLPKLDEKEGSNNAGTTNPLFCFLHSQSPDDANIRYEIDWTLLLTLPKCTCLEIITTLFICATSFHKRDKALFHDYLGWFLTKWLPYPGNRHIGEQNIWQAGITNISVQRSNEQEKWRALIQWLSPASCFAKILSCQRNWHHCNGRNKAVRNKAQKEPTESNPILSALFRDILPFK